MPKFIPQFLASVRNLDEALLVAQHGADIIDLKDPAAGALGAVGAAEMERIVETLQGRHLLSATIGDCPLQPAVVARAISATQASGVDIIKVGWFDAGSNPAVIDCLATATAAGSQIVVVLFAEHGLQLQQLPAFAAAGVHGVMLDTMDKHTGTLRDKLEDEQLAEFVAAARGQRLFCGLAGSLKHADIAPLLALLPDYLGFRGALCSAGERAATLDEAAVKSVRWRINTLMPTQATACARAS